MKTVNDRLENAKTAAPELDDIERYVATLEFNEKQQIQAAEQSIDIAILLNRARRYRGLSQAAAAARAGLKQQAVSRFESPDANPRLDTIQSYLSALGFALELRTVDLEGVGLHREGSTAFERLKDLTVRP